MFIKLTKFNGDPVWINSQYVITVEERKVGGGSVIVPVGDDIDYDVQEEPEAVFKLMGEKPVQAKATRSKAKKTAAAEPAGETPAEEAAEKPAEEAAPKPAKASRKTSAAKQSVEKPAKTAAKKTRAKAAKSAEPSEAEESAAATSAEASLAADAAGQPPKAVLDLGENDVARLRKLAPRTLRKLYNTLMAQFKTADATVTAKALADSGVITVGTDDRIIWNIPF